MRALSTETQVDLKNDGAKQSGRMLKQVEARLMSRRFGVPFPSIHIASIEEFGYY